MNTIWYKLTNDVIRSCRESISKELDNKLRVNLTTNFSVINCMIDVSSSIWDEEREVLNAGDNR